MRPFIHLVPLILFAIATPARAQDAKPPMLTPEEQKLAAEAKKLNDEGVQLYRQGRPAEAVAKMKQVLETYQRLYPAARYPDGHPDLAISLNNLGFLLQQTGQLTRALPYIEQALAMKFKLYATSHFPDGHFDLVVGLNNPGFLLQALGQPAKALPFYEQALAMRQKLGRRILQSASEAEALAYLQAQPLTLDGYLSLSASLPGTDAKVYASVWSAKSAVTRVLEQRHAAARVSGTEHAAKIEQLKDKRRYVDYLLRDTRLPKDDRDKLLTKAVDERDALERELAKAIPQLQRAKELDALGPNDLLPLLPDRVALIDFVKYTKFTHDPAKPGKAGETRSYAAFVVAKPPVADAPGSPIMRVELGDAKPIDGAVAEWRKAIDSRAQTAAPDTLRQLVWAKIAPHLPKGTATLWLALDGDLTRMPWAALPISNDRVLFEDYAIATVPHGPFVLQMIKYPSEYRGDRALLMGGIEYNSKTWPNLPGTATELAALAALAPQPMTLAKTEATAKRLAELLPQARYAHLATHGYFDADTLTAEIERARRAMEARQTGDQSRVVAAQNPLGFVGLVLSQGEVFTGLNLVDLPLENLHLVTLSACETGLGAQTGGEGVQGLQRAFHLAGCPNVVA
jgi:tetratricopeptide (TPR) repeat protein